jgi:hypothetical protein
MSFERTSRGVSARVRRGGDDARAGVRGGCAHTREKTMHFFTATSSWIIDVFCVGVLHLANMDDYR